MILSTDGVFYVPNVVKKRANRTRYNILVVRVSMSGELLNSQPCIMCNYLMRLYGIYRVYYSNNEGQICVQKVSELDSNDLIISRGGSKMVDCWGDDIKTARLPLDKFQKTQLINRLYQARRSLNDINRDSDGDT